VARSGRSRPWLAAWLAMSLLATPARAETGWVEDGWGQVLKYTGCAVSIIAAPSGWGLASAIVLCAVLFEDESW